MTLSTNLSNLHDHKQMFKYPTQAAEKGSEATRIHTLILSRICTMSTRFPLKQVQNGEIVTIDALQPLCNFCCIGITPGSVSA